MARQLPQARSPQAKCKVPTSRFVFLAHMHEIDKWLGVKVPEPWHPPHPEVSGDLIPVTKPTPCRRQEPSLGTHGLGAAGSQPQEEPRLQNQGFSQSWESRLLEHRKERLVLKSRLLLRLKARRKLEIRVRVPALP